MGRIRCIKPEFPQSESVGRLSRDARLLFIQLWTIVDDEGRARAASRMLASLLYPYDDDASSLIDGWLDELVQCGMVQVYEVDSSRYLETANWLKHQKIDHPTKSRLPVFAEGSSVPREVSRSLAPDLGPRIGTLDQDLGPRTKDKDQLINISDFRSHEVKKEPSSEDTIMVLRKKVVEKFQARGLTPPDHLAQIGVWLALGDSPALILAAVDSGIEQRGAKFTSMNYINTVLEVQREKSRPKLVVVEEPKEPPPNKLGSEAHIRILLGLYKKQGYWESGWYCGDKPGRPDCLIDPKLLEEFGLPPTPPRPPEIKRKASE